MVGVGWAGDAMNEFPNKRAVGMYEQGVWGE